MSANSIVVYCNIIGTSSVNVIVAPVIYNFFPNAAKEFNTCTHHFERHFAHVAG